MFQFKEDLNKICKLIKYQDTARELSEEDVDVIANESLLFDNFDDLLYYIYSHDGVNYLYLADDKFSNDELVYHLGEVCTDLYVYEEDTKKKADIVKAGFDCLYRTYMNEYKDCIQLLIRNILFFGDVSNKYCYGVIRNEVVLEILEIVNQIVEKMEDVDPFIRLLLNKRFGKCYYELADYKLQFVDKNNGLEIVRLLGDFQKAYLRNHIEAYDKVFEIFKYPVFVKQNIKIDKNLQYSGYLTKKLNYELINPNDVFDEIIDDFNNERFNACEYKLNRFINEPVIGKYASYNLALLIKNGFISEDIKKAFELFESAKEEGLVEAYYHLTNMFMKGLGTAENHDKAIEYAKISISHDILPAYSQLRSLDKENAGVYKKEQFDKIEIILKEKGIHNDCIKLNDKTSGE